MGLFDKVFGKETTAISLSKQEAFAAVAVAAIAADGEIAPEEVERTATSLVSMRSFRGYALRDMANTLNKVAGLLKRRGTGPVLEAAKAALPKEQMETAFFLAADLLLADGVVEKEEKKFLEELQRTLQVDDATAMKVVEVVVIKNRA